MYNNKNIDSLKFHSLTEENIEAIYQMCENNVRFMSHTFETFKRATLGSDLFKPEFSIVASDTEGKIIAFFTIVFRRTFVFKKKRKVAVLKFFVVDKNWRKKGIGTKIFSILHERIKNSDKKCFRMKFEVMSSMPDYWCPGLDPKQTEAFFFLKKLGFKKKKERVNLCVNLETIPNEPPLSGINKYKVSRATYRDSKELIPLKFMSKKYQLRFWPEEIALSFRNDPISTFIARNPKNNKIIGWASHSIHFPGSFGPTGVSKNARGLGIGSLLLDWCLWDIKQMRSKTAKILWVVDDTIYFYLKSKGAHICEFFWTMKRRV